MMNRSSNRKSPKTIASTQSLSAFVKSICDVMRRSKLRQRLAIIIVPELTWILFPRILDAQEAKAREKAEAVGANFSPALHSPYRWQDWAAPYSDKPEHPKTTPDHNNPAKPFGWKRHARRAGRRHQPLGAQHSDVFPVRPTARHAAWSTRNALCLRQRHGSRRERGDQHPEVRSGHARAGP